LKKGKKSVDAMGNGNDLNSGLMNVPDSYGMNEIANKIQAKLDSAKRKFVPTFGKQSVEKVDGDVNEFKAPLEVIGEKNIDLTPNGAKRDHDRTPSTIDATANRQKSSTLRQSSTSDATPQQW
jgi:hypothetical protein